MSEAGLNGIGCYKLVTQRDHAMWAHLQEFCKNEPRAFDRDPATGHVTGSAFVMSQDMESVLLTHHAKLDRWLQLGGHCDGIADVPFVARKEAYEESGLRQIERLGTGVFDVDIHEIPARRTEAAHLHFDVRYLFRAVSGTVSVSEESHALEWVPVGKLGDYTDAPSVLVLREKLDLFVNGGA